MKKDDLKVVLLGHWYCGKTCLVHRYVFTKFIEKPKNIYQPTIGAEYNSVIVKINRSQIKLGLWDTAGEEKYLSITKTYLRGLTAAIICYDLSQFSTFELSKYWVNEVSKMNDSCKIYLCGCKLDLIDSNPELRQNCLQMASDYGQSINAQVFETSSKTGQGVNELFEQIARDYYNSRSGLTFADFHKTTLFQIESSRRRCC